MRFNQLSILVGIAGILTAGVNAFYGETRSEIMGWVAAAVWAAAYVVSYLPWKDRSRG